MRFFFSLLAAAVAAAATADLVRSLRVAIVRALQVLLLRVWCVEKSFTEECIRCLYSPRPREREGGGHRIGIYSWSVTMDGMAAVGR